MGGEESLSEDLEESGLGHINDGDSVLIGGVEGSGLFGEEGPDLVEVDGGEEESVSLEGEGSDTLLSEVAGMITIHGGSIIGEATSVTTTSRMLSVFSNTTVTGGNVSALLTILMKTSRLIRIKLMKKKN